jgi:hypothetical protein
LWLITVWFSASTFVVKIATFAKPENGKNGEEKVREGKKFLYLNAGAASRENRFSESIRISDPKNKETDNFEKRFSFYYDYDGSTQLIGSKLTEALDVIFERITQDIFNESLAKW